MSNIIVQKFGGTSVASPKRIEAVAKIVGQEIDSGNHVAVVVSAMAGETNRLIDLTKKIQKKPDPREFDAVVSSGEQVSAALLAMSLKKKGYNSRSYNAFQMGFKTDSSFGRARIRKVSEEILQDALEKNIVPVITGFQGFDDENNITTLGRGGSDTSAVAIAVSLNAKECQIYTDVDGVFTTDPNIYDKARKLDHLTYEEMLELSSLGAKVLQIRSVEFASKYKLPLRVLSSFGSNGGTLINSNDNLEEAVVSGIAFTSNEAKITIRKVPDIPGVAAKILSPISDAGIEVDVIVQNVASDNTTDFTFTVHKDFADETSKILEKLRKELGSGEIEVDLDICKVSVVGNGMKSHAGVASKMFGALADEAINIEMISTSEIKISVVLEEKYKELAVRTLHDAFELDKN